MFIIQLWNGLTQSSRWTGCDAPLWKTATLQKLAFEKFVDISSSGSSNSTFAHPAADFFNNLPHTMVRLGRMISHHPRMHVKTAMQQIPNLSPGSNKTWICETLFTTENLENTGLMPEDPENTGTPLLCACSPAGFREAPLAQINTAPILSLPSQLPASVAEQIRRAQVKAALSGQAPPAWAIGAKVEAPYSADGQFYNAVIEAVSLNGNFIVAFDGYPDKEEVRGFW